LRERAILVVEAERLRQVGIEVPQRRSAPIRRLRRFAQSLRCRFARAVCGGEIGAPVE